MLSILHPEPEMDPKIRKRIAQFSSFAIAFVVCGLILTVVHLVMRTPPRSLSLLSNVATLIGSLLGVRSYRLRNPRCT